SINGLSARLSRRGIADLASDPRVVSISPDRTVRRTMDIAYATTGAEAAHLRTDVTGAHVSVAVVDSGIVPSASIPAERIIASVDLIDEATAHPPTDPYGHGTHVAGIIGSANNASIPG